MRKYTPVEGESGRSIQLKPDTEVIKVGRIKEVLQQEVVMSRLEVMDQECREVQETVKVL